VARALGFAGLLPQVAVIVDALLAPDGQQDINRSMSGLALVYAAVILSFLGGMWWSMAMRRTTGQAWLAGAAVLPSLTAFGSFVFLDANWQRDWALIVVGSAIIFTLFVDRHLATTGEAPEGWMRLRVPLSLGLGGLTIAAGVLAGG
jgi:FtsH-binding integral membrane protein